MSEPIFDPDFWRRRLAVGVDREQSWHAVYQCDHDTWRRIAGQHREILARQLRFDDSVLDVGCGWGRLLGMMPATWTGEYLGVDLSPDFLAVARASHPGRAFLQHDLRQPLDLGRRQGRFDWAILVSVKEMVEREAGSEVWNQILRNVRRLTHRVLCLEYSGDDQGLIL